MAWLWFSLVQNCKAALKAIGATMAAEWAAEAGATGAEIMAKYNK